MLGRNDPVRLAARVAAVLTHTARNVGLAGLEALGEVSLKLSARRRAETKRRDRQRPTQGDRCYTDDERATVAALACLIVPSDDDAPGADDIDVLGPSAVQLIEQWVSRSPTRRVHARGLIALDEMARKAHGVPFTALSVERQREVFGVVEARYAESTGLASSPVLAKIGRKLKRILAMLQGWGPAVDLYPVIVNDVMKAFYTSEVAWVWLGYDGPPMPEGYPSLAGPRPRKKIPPISAPDIKRPASSSRTNTPDVVVVGCGAGGAVVAKELAEAGLSVVVLEAGRRYEPYNDYLTDRTDFEIGGKDVFDPADERRDLYTTSVTEGFSYHRVKGIGGSTLHYAGMSPRFHESDFRVHSEDGVADDWPFGYAELEPYYTRVEYELGISGPDGANPFEPPRSRPYPNPPHPFNLASQAIKRGADKLGLHMVREPLALPSREWQGRPACVGAGTCQLGCLISAKSSMDVTYARKAEATGKVDIRTECMATEIEMSAQGRASAVVYLDGDRRRQRVQARAVVLAGNAVETPRLLLMNASGRFPDGLANSSGLVGRNFTEHLAVFAWGQFQERIDPWRGTPTGGMIQDYYATRPGSGFVRGWTALVSSNSHWPLTVARRLPGWGAAHKKSVAEAFGHYVCLTSIGEQLPDERNRVELDPVLTDNLGLPVPRLVNHPRENDKAMIRAIKQNIETLLTAAGATKTWGNEHFPGMSSHYFGTCRMGRNPAESVVDPWGRAHDISNLFIADGSVFVTGGAVNPALTISALALRTSEGIIASFRRGEL